jgi:hypothetical protein
VLGSNGADGAAEQLRQEAVVAAHAADGGQRTAGARGGTRLVVAPHGSELFMDIAGDRSISDGWEKLPHMVDRPIDS